jgi:hypothetical protein
MDIVDKKLVEDRRRKKEEKRRKIKEERKNRLKEKANQQAVAKGTFIKSDEKSAQKHKEQQIEKKMNDANVEQIDDEVML